MVALISEKHEQLAAICGRYGVIRLDLFGSAVREDFCADRSDLDFVVEFSAPPDGDRFGQFFGLKEDLEALFGCPVDLISSSALHNPYFIAEIAESKVTVYAT